MGQINLLLILIFEIGEIMIKGNFTQVPNSIIGDKNLSLRAKGLYLYIKSKPFDWLFYISQMATETKDSVGVIRSTLKELEEKKYLFRTRTNGKGGKFAYRYYVSNDGKPFKGETAFMKKNNTSTNLTTVSSTVSGNTTDG